MKKTRTKRTARYRRREREGAAMLVVMLVLLATTSLAVFAVQATSYEVRASGFARQSMQSEYVAEAGLTSTLTLVDRLGPQSILYNIQQQQATGTARPVMAPFEPELATTGDRPAEGYRIYGADMTSFTATGTAPVSIAALGGASRTSYTPEFAVDIYDHHLSARPIPGYPADGGGLSFFHATYTSRGRMRLTAGDRAVAGPDPRQYHETASGARAYGVSGPFAR